MSEALRAIVTFAFATMRLARIEAVVDEGNEHSQGMLRKLGFTHESNCRDVVTPTLRIVVNIRLVAAIALLSCAPWNSSGSWCATVK